MRTKARRIPPGRLRNLRNDVAILAVVSRLGIPTRRGGARLSFRCPGCAGFRTAVNPWTNLARCFRCERNFNPIDLVMAQQRVRFTDAVGYLEANFGV